MRYGQLLKTITPRKGRLLAVLALLLAGAFFALVNPLIAGELTAVLLGGSAHTGLGVRAILLIWLCIMLCKALVSMLSGYLTDSTGAQVSARLRSRVYEHMQILPLAYLQERRQGDVLALLSSDAEAVSRFVTDTLVRLLPLVVTFACAFAIMVWIDPPIAMLAALLMPAYYVVMKLVGRRIRPLSAAWIKSWSGIIAFVNENLGLMPVLKAFGREAHESGRFTERNTKLLSLSKRQALFNSILSPMVGLLAGFGAILLLWVGIAHVESGRLQPSELVSLLLYAMLLTQPLSGLANAYGQVMRARGAAGRLLEFFGHQPEPDYAVGTPLRRVRGNVEFANISFGYPGLAPVLEDFNLQIAHGETIALTGPNGSEKSTLVHLLMRFMEPTAGRILIDGIDISRAELGSLRSQVGLVAQHTLLLNGTVAENIGYGYPMAGRELLIKAAKSAHALDFIQKLPNGFDTLIGDQGIKLSGGQRQRLSLARTLLKDPPIIVLDEATSMFDPDGEARFIRDSRGLLEERTVILITHRPAALALADRILEMPFGTEVISRAAS